MDVDLRDRIAVTDLIHRFAMAIDDRDWTVFADCLQDPVSVELDSSIGGSDPSPQAVADRVKLARKFFEPFEATHHHVTVYSVRYASIDSKGDELEVRSYFRAGHFKRHFVGGASFEQMGDYRHRCVRTDDGWRISGWKQRIAYTAGNTALLARGGDAADD